MPNLLDVPLTADFIDDYLEGNTRIIRYDDIFKYSSLKSLMGWSDNVFILYCTTERNLGHWTVLYKCDGDDETVHFFDSYGFFVDDELRFSPYLQETKDGIKYLSQLIATSGMNLIANNVRYQNKGQTCGRWCIHRYLKRHLSEKEYYELWRRHKKDWDLLICTVIN